MPTICELKFDAATLLSDLEAADTAAFDAAPFGIVRLDADHCVTAYNRAESKLSGLSVPTVTARNFFTDVAPCTNNYMVAQRFEECDELDECVDYVFTFRMKPTPVELRLLKSASARHRYVVVMPR